VVLGIALFLPAIASAAEKAESETAAAIENLRAIGRAIHNCHDTIQEVPASCSCDAKGNKLLSWRVLLLPYMDQKKLYDRFRLDEPWDSAHNRKLIAEMPAVYRSPGHDLGEGKTSILGFVHDKAALAPSPPRRGKGSLGRPLSFAALVDGMSNVAVLAEASPDQAVVWTQPQDIDFNPERPKVGLSGHRLGKFLVLTADGRVRRVPATVEEAVMMAFVTRDDGKLIDLTDWKLPKVYAAEGRVVFRDGSPVTSGQVFLSSDRWPYPFGSAISDDGTFFIEAVPAERFSIWIRGKSNVSPKYHNPETSGLTLEIPARDTKDLVIKVEKADKK
jgi:hypothetical protein